jgi:hypothetical protein
MTPTTDPLETSVADPEFLPMLAELATLFAKGLFPTERAEQIAKVGDEGTRRAALALALRTALRPSDAAAWCLREFCPLSDTHVLPWALTEDDVFAAVISWLTTALRSDDRSERLEAVRLFDMADEADDLLFALRNQLGESGRAEVVRRLDEDARVAYPELRDGLVDSDEATREQFSAVVGSGFSRLANEAGDHVLRRRQGMGVVVGQLLFPAAGSSPGGSLLSVLRAAFAAWAPEPATLGTSQQAVASAPGAPPAVLAWSAREVPSGEEVVAEGTENGLTFFLSPGLADSRDTLVLTTEALQIEAALAPAATTGGLEARFDAEALKRLYGHQVDVRLVPAGGSRMDAAPTESPQSLPDVARIWMDEIYSLLPEPLPRLFTPAEWHEAVPFVQAGDAQGYEARRTDVMGSLRDRVRFAWLRRMGTGVKAAFAAVGRSTLLAAEAVAAASEGGVSEEQRVVVGARVDGQLVTLGFYLDTAGDLVFTLRDQKRQLADGTCIDLDLRFVDGSRGRLTPTVEGGLAEARLRSFPGPTLAHIEGWVCRLATGAGDDRSPG